MITAIKHLDKMRARALKGGGKERIQKQHDKGKLFARERIDILLDKGSFTEMDMFVKHRSNDFAMEKNRILTDGVITGSGWHQIAFVFDDREDATVSDVTKSIWVDGVEVTQGPIFDQF